MKARKKKEAPKLLKQLQSQFDKRVQKEPAKESLPKQIYLIPVCDRPFFPPQTLPLIFNAEEWQTTLQQAEKKSNGYVGIVLCKADTFDETTIQRNLCRVGTLVRVHHLTESGNQIQFIAEGIRRFKIKEWVSKKIPFCVEVTYPDEEHTEATEENRAYEVAIVHTLRELIPLNPIYSEELKFFINRFAPNDLSRLADFSASLVSATRAELQRVLSYFNVHKRLKKVAVLLKKEIELVKLQREISQEVTEKLSEQQREFFLNEQLKIIQRELGISKDDRTADLEKFEQKVESLSLPNDVKELLQDELDKIAILEPGSPEYAITRNYLDAMTGLPWGKYTKDKLGLKRAHDILNREHEGLENIKDRIMEFMAIGALKGKISGTILLLVGPPGVGKTSIGRSIAKAIGRRFYRFSVGGMRDEAEIKGHRRTYIGAMPGKIIQAIKELKTANPVIMLDEIDKIGASFQGDPASALLEVLDPEQNQEFLDHFLDVRFDLSKVLFLCTANQLDTIPQALLDRMEVLHLPGYITAEKMEIAKKHLLPKQLHQAGLTRHQLHITDSALKHIIESYAREAGVRTLEKKLNRIARKVAVKIVNKKATAIRIGVHDLDSYLGAPSYLKEKPLSGVGVVTGLAWTTQGGATLDIEATARISKQPGFKFTGQMGDVMRESAEIAYSYVCSHFELYGVPLNQFEDKFIHLHIPEGATPKDGPSAGITMATALLSLARDQRITRPVAMTGELTLTGHILPVGGIREKLVAAKRNRIFEIIMPEGIRRDFDELPRYLKDDLTVHFVQHYEKVFDIVFNKK